MCGNTENIVMVNLHNIFCKFDYYYLIISYVRLLMGSATYKNGGGAQVTTDKYTVEV